MYYCSHCGASVSGAGRCPCCGVLLVSGGASGSEAGKASLKRSYLKNNSILYNIWLCIRRVLLTVFGIAGIAIFCGGVVLIFYNPPFADFNDVFERICGALFIIVIGWSMGRLLFKK